MASFFLYKMDGIFQSPEDVTNHYTEVVQPDGSIKNIVLQPDAKPGDIRFKDLNNDGVIDENDKEYCGSGIPKLEANLSFGGSYKGVDLSFLLGSAWGINCIMLIACIMNQWTQESICLSRRWEHGPKITGVM